MVRILPTLRESLLGALIALAIGGAFGGIEAMLGAREVSRSAVVGAAGGGILMMVCWPIFHRRQVRKTLTSVADALDYHEGYLMVGGKAEDPEYARLWREKRGVLENEPALAATRLATSRAFDALARVRDGSETPYDALAEVRRAQGFIRRALNDPS